MLFVQIDEKDIIENLLEGYDYPAAVISDRYDILGANTAYRNMMKDRDISTTKCFSFFRGLDRPCHHYGDACPLLLTCQTNKKERVMQKLEDNSGIRRAVIESSPVASGPNFMLFLEVIKLVPQPMRMITGQSVSAANGELLPVLQKLLTQSLNLDKSNGEDSTQKAQKPSKTPKKSAPKHKANATQSTPQNANAPAKRNRGRPPKQMQGLGNGLNADTNAELDEEAYLVALIDKFDGDKSKAAEAAGISLRSLYRKLNA